MARIGSHAERKMLKAAIELAHKKGLSGFSVRELCARAKVNSGMFNYCFKRKEILTESVLKAIYGEMIKRIELNISSSKTPKENITEILTALSAFLQNNRKIISAFAGDVLSLKISDKKIFGNFTTHIKLLSEELSRAKKEKMLATDSITNALLILVAPFVIPQVIQGYMERTSHNKSIHIYDFNSDEFDKTIDERIKIIVNAVFKEGVK
ncbi:MAG: TetR family transcriptional regulator [Endomicrobiaceae bacterium]|nr:TetR family transcriptional regulator [Endomicrobiaceae bacterium]